MFDIDIFEKAKNLIQQIEKKYPVTEAIQYDYFNEDGKDVIENAWMSIDPLISIRVLIDEEIVVLIYMNNKSITQCAFKNIHDDKNITEKDMEYIFSQIDIVKDPSFNYEAHDWNDIWDM